MIKIKVKVNEDACIGCGACQALVSSVFEINDEGVATVITEEIDDNLKEDVRDAAEGCPTCAIEINE